MVTGADLQVVEARGVVAISRALSLRHTRDVKAQGVSADAKPHRPPHRIPRSYMHVAVPHVPRKAQSSVAYRAAIGLLVCYFAFMTQMQMQAQAAHVVRCLRGFLRRIGGHCHIQEFEDRSSLHC